MTSARVQVVEAPLYLNINIAFAKEVSFGVVADKVCDRASDLQEFFIIIKDLLVSPVPSDQSQLRVDYANTGGEVFERRR